MFNETTNSVEALCSQPAKVYTNALVVSIRHSVCVWRDWILDAGVACDKETKPALRLHSFAGWTARIKPSESLNYRPSYASDALQSSKRDFPSTWFTHRGLFFLFNMCKFATFPTQTFLLETRKFMPF